MKDVEGESPLGGILEEPFVEGALVVHNELGVLLEECGEAM